MRIAAVVKNGFQFLREVRSEMRKVTWPNRRETIVFTSVVIISVGIIAGLIWIMDLILTTILRLVIKV
ncbi:MAG TPA: preprotein translocase subunit SecE [Firmicutes bacterium]|jgi:preprotein translocase subunit SecE|nr:preprotein translocase subunit SecE [Bacillota bacterium]